MLLNDAAEAQPVTVTVYKGGVGPKTVLPPAPMTTTLAPGEVFHDANPVGNAGPFVPGFYYEAVVETTTSYVLPGVHVWQDRANTIFPGMLIPAGSWVRIR